MRKYLGQISAVYLHQIVSLIVGIASVPIALPYFGGERYGLLAIVWTLITYLGLINFGLPTALRVFLAATRDRLKRLIVFRMIFFTITVISVFATIALLLFGVSKLLPMIGGIDNQLLSEATEVVFIAFLFYFLSAPFLSYSEAFAGIGQLEKAKIYEIINLLAGFVALIWTVYLDLGLVEFFFMRGLAGLTVAVCALVHFLLSSKNLGTVIVPGSNSAETNNFEITFPNVLRTGALHFSAGIATLLVWHVDNILISHLFGLEEVAAYSITFKLVTTTFLCFTAMSMIVSPIYGRLLGEGQTEELRELHNAVVGISPILGGLAWLGAISFGPEIIGVWAGSEGYAGLWVVVALGAYGYILSFVHVNMALASALNTISTLPLIAFCEGVFNLGLSFVLGKVLGLTGVALGTLMAATFSALWMIPRMINRDSRIRAKFEFFTSTTRHHFFACLFPLLIITLGIRALEYNTGLKVATLTLLVFIYTFISWRFVPREAKVWLLRNKGKPRGTAT